MGATDGGKVELREWKTVAEETIRGWNLMRKLRERRGKFTEG